MTYNPSSRRNFLKTLSTSTILTTTAVPALAASVQDTSADKKIKKDRKDKKNKRITSLKPSPKFEDGPSSPLFEVVSFTGNRSPSDLNIGEISEEMKNAAVAAPIGQTTSWGIPFKIESKILF